MSGVGLSGYAKTGEFQDAAQQQQQDSKKAVDAQTQTNRPNQYNPYGSVEWSKDDAGNWTQNTSLNPEDQARLEAQRGQQMGLYGKANDLMGSLQTGPMDFGGLPQLNSGDAARTQAINAAYGQATSRLDPQWQAREEAERANLANQGLDPSSEAYGKQMGMLGQSRNDAYSSAMNGAIGQGTSAGNALFNQSLQARQQGMSELLRQREEPYSNLAQLMGSEQGVGNPQMEGFNAAGASQPGQWLQALQNSGQWQLGFGNLYNESAKLQNQNDADTVNGIGGFFGSVLGGLFGV